MKWMDTFWTDLVYTFNYKKKAYLVHIIKTIIYIVYPLIFTMQTLGIYNM